MSGTGPESLRPLREVAESVGVTLLLVTAPLPEGDVVVQLSHETTLVSIREGELLPADLPGLDEQSLPIIDPSAGHVHGSLRWVRGTSRTALDHPELEVLGVCAQQIAEAIGDEGAGLAGAPQWEGPAASTMRLLAALAARGLRHGWEFERVIQLSEAVGRELDLGPDQMAEVIELAMLRDVGSLGIPDRVLGKRGLLSRSEARLLQEQPILGERIVAVIPELASLAPLVRASHERFDGSGYPDGLAGEQIPLPCRIVQACNAQVAMISDRPYRKALPPEAVTKILREKSGSQFCPLSVATLTGVLLIEPHVGTAEEKPPAAVATAPPLRRAPEPSRRQPAPPRKPAPAGAQRSLGKRPAAAGGGAAPPRTGRTSQPVGAARTAIARDRTPQRAAKVLYPLGLIVGLAAGLAVALPIDSADGRCPNPGEAGRVQCLLDKVYLHEATIVFVVMLAVMLVGYVLFFKLPDIGHRARAGELFSKPPPAAVDLDDLALSAAAWGHKPHSR